MLSKFICLNLSDVDVALYLRRHIVNQFWVYLIKNIWWIFGNYMFGETKEFPHWAIIVNCYSHIAAFTARYNGNVLKSFNNQYELKRIRLKYMKLLKMALSGHEIELVLCELKMIFNIQYFPTKNQLKCDGAKDWEEVIGKEQIIAAVNADNKNEVFKKVRTSHPTSRRLSTHISDARESYDYSQDEIHVTNELANKLANKYVK